MAMKREFDMTPWFVSHEARQLEIEKKEIIMAKSKKQTLFEEIDALASTYKKFTDQQLIDFINRPFRNTQKKYRVAVKNEIERRGLKVE